MANILENGGANLWKSHSPYPVSTDLHVKNENIINTRHAEGTFWVGWGFDINGMLLFGIIINISLDTLLLRTHPTIKEEPEKKNSGGYELEDCECTEQVILHCTYVSSRMYEQIRIKSFACI